MSIGKVRFFFNVEHKIEIQKNEKKKRNNTNFDDAIPIDSPLI